MILLGTLVNAIAIITGAALGILLRRGIPDRVKTIVMQGIGLAVILIGLKMALSSEATLLVIGSMAAGGVVGEILGIERGLERLGLTLKKRFEGREDSTFVTGFMTASLVYCVGAMAIMGSLESGLSGVHTTLYAKSMLDGTTALVFASSLGVGVAFSALPILVYQGAITLLAGWIAQFLSPEVIGAMEATGGLLILAIGLSILDIVKMPVANLLPAILFAAVLAALL